MKLHIKNFVDFLRKSTVQYVGDYTQLIFNDGKVRSSLINQEKTIISKIEIENNIISDLDKNLEINIISPEANIIPYLALFESDEVDLEYLTKSEDENAIISHLILKEGEVKTKLNMSTPMPTRYFTKTPKNMDIVFSTSIDSEFISSLNKLKKIATRTNNIYLVSEKYKFRLETGDRKSPHINSVFMELDRKTEKESFVALYAYNNFQSVMKTFTEEDNFHLDIMERNGKFIAHIFKDDNSEEHYLLPLIDS